MVCCPVDQCAGIIVDSSSNLDTGRPMGRAEIFLGVFGVLQFPNFIATLLRRNESLQIKVDNRELRESDNYE